MENKIDWVKIRNEIINEIKKDDEIFDTEGRLAFGGQNNQYKEIYWIRLYLLDKVIESLKDTKYEGATAIHIMPYCITAEDVENAEEKGKSGFAERKAGHVDYDPDSGNFHKKIKYENYNIDDVYPQIVLVYKDGKKPFGPGKKQTKIQSWNKMSMEERLNAIKTHWYFPPIGEINENDATIQSQKDFEDMINALLNDVTTAIQKAIEEKQEPAVE